MPEAIFEILWPARGWAVLFACLTIAYTVTTVVFNHRPVSETVRLSYFTVFVWCFALGVTLAPLLQTPEMEPVAIQGFWRGGITPETCIPGETFLGDNGILYSCLKPGSWPTEVYTWTIEDVQPADIVIRNNVYYGGSGINGGSWTSNNIILPNALDEEGKPTLKPERPKGVVIKNNRIYQGQGVVGWGNELRGNNQFYTQEPKQ